MSKSYAAFSGDADRLRFVLVYTDNYLPSDLSVKNHSLVVKFTLLVEYLSLLSGLLIPPLEPITFN